MSSAWVFYGVARGSGDTGNLSLPWCGGGERFVPLEVGELTFLTIPKNIIFPLELF